MKMRNIIIDKLLIILLGLCLLFFVSCNDKKICDVDALVQRVYSGDNITIFENALNCKVEQNEHSLNEWEIKFPKTSYLLGTTYIKNDLKKNPITYLWFYEDEMDYKKGMIILMLSKYRIIKGKGRNKTIKDSYYLIDYKFVPGFTDKITLYAPVSYGEPVIDYGFKHYNMDENIFGIYAYEDKYPPYNKKVKPKYLVYVENDKLVVEEPKDDKYFIYRIPEL